jgi:hypothetical protein
MTKALILLSCVALLILGTYYLFYRESLAIVKIHNLTEHDARVKCTIGSASRRCTVRAGATITERFPVTADSHLEAVVELPDNRVLTCSGGYFTPGAGRATIKVMITESGARIAFD